MILANDLLDSIKAVRSQHNSTEWNPTTDGACAGARNGDRRLAGACFGEQFDNFGGVLREDNPRCVPTVHVGCVGKEGLNFIGLRLG